ncbi:hypothetical protein KVF89_29380 [Nocardioides carbamazepini]|jgi:hypothetical protein|uniref:hypothetical protein n=1 Tax=Nocardioides carbamazepini TaxID=2854259 RepID=UPI00214A1549|nr:hypothetical protein [Nocardioides carbamazepini]MCR1786684.1 hypothetical protein [Nocardioides carbamazepini]
MRTRIPGLLLAATVGLSGLLTACGSDDADKPDSEDKTSQTTETEDTDAGDAPESDAPEGDDTTEGDEADGDKPSRDDVVAGYAEVVKQTGEQTGIDMPEDIVNKVVTCFIDEVYEDASAKTLQALADADATGIDPADAELFVNAQTTCQKAAMG